MRVLILSGIPGAGKSSWTIRLANLLYGGGRHLFTVSADDYHRERSREQGLDYDNGGAGFDPVNNAKAHPACFRRFLRVLTNNAERGDVVVVDNTNLSAWEVAPYILAGQAFEAEVSIVRFAATREDANRNRHGVPSGVLDRMFKTYQNPDFMPWWHVTDANGIEHALGL